MRKKQIIQAGLNTIPEVEYLADREQGERLSLEQRLIEPIVRPTIRGGLPGVGEEGSWLRRKK